jgi:quinol monooxygenase YgiN
MYGIIRKYTASSDTIDEARPKLADLEQTMRQLPGFVAYYFLETEDGLATITVLEDEASTQESMGQAASWVKQNLPQTGASLGAPQVTRGQALIAATR